MKPGDTQTEEQRELRDPFTGRRILQLTSGDGDDYPLYYFIPTVTRDGRSLVFHRLRGGEVQYYRLDLETGRSVCLTAARTPVALWRPWLQKPAIGVREYMGALNQVTDELAYFDGNDLRAVHLFTLADRLVARVPEGRVPCSQTGISPDGRHFVYAHVDQAWWDAHEGKDPDRATARGAKVDVIDLATGAASTALTINGWITHAQFYDNERILLSHPPTEQGILMVDLTGEWYMSIRAQGPDGAQTCHYQSTLRGVMYELNTYEPQVRRDRGRMGVYVPETRDRREYRVAARITHIGLDPEGLFWFGEQLQEVPRLGRLIGYCPRLAPGELNAFIPLTEAVQTYGSQALQRAHVHPALMPDRKHILFTRGDERTQTNHPCLLDIADLAGAQTEVSP